TLVTVSLAAIGLSAFGQAAWLVTSFASYARKDARTPLRASVLRNVIVSVPGLAVAYFFLGGTALLVALGVTVSASTLAGSLYLAMAIRRQLPASGEPLVPAGVRDVGASVLMLAVAYPIAVGIPHAVGGRTGYVVAIVVAAVVGGAVYLGIQRLWPGPGLG